MIILYELSRIVKLIKTGNRRVVAKVQEQERMSSLMITEFQFRKMIRILDVVCSTI